MSILSRSLLPNPTFRIDYLISHSRTSPTIKAPNFTSVPRINLIPSTSHLHTTITCDGIRTRRWQINLSETNGILFDDQTSRKSSELDSLLAAAEFALLASSVIVSVGCSVKWAFLRQHSLCLIADRVLVWLLAGAVVVGAAIRRRQWRRVCGISTTATRESGNVIERIEKLEESLRSATTIIRVLSRQLEKLGIRFRVTRKALKDPIEETAALAQKNSEATRALAAQETILEKELGEVQKVLLAMQDQQQKQIELILAIAKNGNLFDSNRPAGQLENQVSRTGNSKPEVSNEQEDSPEPHAVSG